MARSRWAEQGRSKTEQCGNLQLVSLSILTWQSRVEIKYYSGAYFDHVTVFKALYLQTSIQGGAQTRGVITSIAELAAFTQHV